MLLRTSALLFSAAIFGSLSATPLTTLVSTANAVVVGTESAPTQAGNTVTFNLNVERVLSGNVQIGATLNVIWNAIGSVGLPDSAPSYRGIWFLKAGTNGNWECLSAGASGNAEFFPDLSLPASVGPLPAQLAYDAGSTPLSDQIILETAAGTPRSNSKMLLDVISEVKSAGALQALRYLAASQSNDQSVVGITGLIRAGDTGGLLAAEALAGSLSAGTPGADWISSAIKLFFRSTDPSAIASLGRMATSGAASPLMRDSAAQALAAIHSAAALPALGVLLNSSSPAMQVYGARGLSYFVNGVGIPTARSMPTLSHLNQRQPSVYRTPETDRHIGYAPGQEESFIQYWQAWWASRPELLDSSATH
jgi:hypothetical protein